MMLPNMLATALVCLIDFFFTFWALYADFGSGLVVSIQHVAGLYKICGNRLDDGEDDDTKMSEEDLRRKFC